MAVIASNIVIGGKKEVKPEPVAAPQKTLSSFDELKQQSKPFRNKQVIIEKRAKLTDPKPDRKSAYVRDMTTTHKI